MFGLNRRRPTPDEGARFCDACAQVSTTAQRANQHYDRQRTQAYETALRAH